MRETRRGFLRRKEVMSFGPMLVNVIVTKSIKKNYILERNQKILAVRWMYEESSS